MGFTVKQLLETEEMKKMKVLAGQEGISNEIQGVTIIEAPDIVRFIDGGELLLTGLYAFQSNTVEEFREYIRTFEEKKVSGVVIKKGRKVSHAPEKIAILEEYSRQHHMPLIEVPFEISFQRILSLVMEHLFGEEVTRLKYYKTTHDNFTALSLTDSYKEHPVEDILDMLGKLIRNPVALYNQNMVCYAATEDDSRNFALTEKAGWYDPGIISNYSYLKQEGENSCYIVQINLNVGKRMYLVITERTSEFSQMDCIATENAIVALQYEFSREYAVSELEKKFQNDILNSILEGKLKSAEEIHKSTLQLGIEPDGDYRVAVFETEQAGGSGKEIKETYLYIDNMEEGLRLQFPDIRLHKDVDHLVALIPVPAKKSGKEDRSELTLMLNRAKSSAAFPDDIIKVRAGAGNIVHGISAIPDSYRQAQDACSFVDIMKELHPEEEPGIIMFSDMGIFKLLSRITDPSELGEYVPDSLKRLYACKKNQREDLVATLRTYLDYNQNLNKTAQSLFIHYKTASYRLEKITKITGMDFNDPQEMLAVRIGLIVEKMIEKMESAGE